MSYRKSKKKRTQNTISTIQKDMHTENNGEKLNMDNNQVSSNEKVEDWDKEIDGSEITQEVTETPINEEVKVEPIKSNEEQQASTNGSVRVNKENSFKEPTIIHLIDGEKGGCGKSFFSRTFIEYCNSIAYDIAIVDADKLLRS